MSHVDDGALHAYLDGALEEYPIAEARRVREHLEFAPSAQNGWKARAGSALMRMPSLVWRHLSPMLLVSKN